MRLIDRVRGIARVVAVATGLLVIVAPSRAALASTACETEPNPTPEGVSFVPCQVVVKFYPAVDPVPIISAVGTSEISNLRQQLTDSPLNGTTLTQAEIPPDIWDMADIHYVQITDPGKTVAQAISDFEATGDVEFAEPNTLSQMATHEPTPNDPLFVRKWDLLNVGQTGQNGACTGAGAPTACCTGLRTGNCAPACTGAGAPIPCCTGAGRGTCDGIIDADMDAPQGWQLHRSVYGFTDCRSVLVGVMDTGVDFTHPELVNNAWTGPGGIHGANFTASPVNFDVSDNDGHGTFVAGLIAAEGNNGLDISGVCWRAQIIALKAENGNGFASADTAAATIASAAYNIAVNFFNLNLPPIRVLNMSFGPNLPQADHLNALANAIANSTGILVVAAAGNSRVNVDGGEIGWCGTPQKFCADVGLTKDCKGSTCRRQGVCVGGPTPGMICGGNCMGGPTPNAPCEDLGVVGGQCGVGGTCQDNECGAGGMCQGSCVGGPNPGMACNQLGFAGGVCGAGGRCLQRFGRCEGGPKARQFCTNIGMAGGFCGAGGRCIDVGFMPCQTEKDLATLAPPLNGLQAPVLCVGASTHKDAMALFSNYGATSVHLVAPGQSVHSLSATYDTDMNIYRHPGAAGTVVVGDTRLGFVNAPDHPLSTNSAVVANDPDVDSRLSPIPTPPATTTPVRHDEVNPPNGTFDPPNECIYRDMDNNGSVSCGDIRFGNSSVCPDGTVAGRCGGGPTPGKVCTDCGVAGGQCGAGGTCAQGSCVGGPTPGIACTDVGVTGGQCGAAGTCSGDADVGNNLVNFAANEMRTSTRWGNGTSFSSPDVAGMAALCLSIPDFHDLPPTVTRNMMMRFVDRKTDVADAGVPLTASSSSRGRARWMCTADLGDFAQAPGTHDPFGYNTLQREPLMRVGTPAIPAVNVRGPVHLDTGNEWLGENVSNEHNADTPPSRDEDPTENVTPADSDVFDDGFIGFTFGAGGIVTGVRARICSDVFGMNDGAGGRYGAATKRLFLNGFFDWNGDDDFDLPGEHNLDFPIDPTILFAPGSVANTVPPPTNCVLVLAPFVIPAPRAGIPKAWRLRVDYGEDVSGAIPFGYRVGDPLPATNHLDIATFGEVEDYLGTQFTPYPYCMVDCRTFGRFGKRADISCDLVANDPGGAFQLGTGSMMTDGSVMIADQVRLLADTSIWSAFFNTLHTGLGAVIRDGTGVPTLPVLNPFPTVAPFACSGPDVIVAPFQSVTLPPGTYNRVRLLTGGTLTLDPGGTFNFCSLRTARPGNIFIAGTDQTTINIAETLRIADASVLQSLPGIPGAIINVAGRSVRIGRGAELDAFVTAPNALMKPGRGSILNGTFIMNACGSDKAVHCGCEIIPPFTTTTTTTTTTTSTL